MNSEEKEAYAEALKKIEECRAKGENGKSLYLSNMGLSALPPEVGQLAALEDLTVYVNHLSTLPPEVGELFALESLRVGRNLLSTLPTQLGMLTALKVLVVDNNLIGRLPNMTDCRAIEKMSFVNADLQRLPRWLQELPKLTHLIVTNCHQLGVPTETAGPDGEGWGDANAQQVLDYYFSRQEQGECPLNEVKLLLVGRGEAGKTCLSRALRALDFDS